MIAREFEAFLLEQEETFLTPAEKLAVWWRATILTMQNCCLVTQPTRVYL